MQASPIKKIFAPSPITQQGIPSYFISSEDGQWLSYVVKKSVVLRKMDDPTQVRIFSKHTSETTSLAFHPKGELIASSDVKGTILIWNINTKRVDQTIEGIFNGKIYGLEFSADGNNLLIYGESKQFPAKVINWSNKEELGPLEGLSKTIWSGCFTKSNAVLVGGTDNLTNFFAGTPYEMKAKAQEHLAGKFVTSIKMSPDGSKIVSCGMDKKIVVYDANDGKVLDSFDSSKAANGHKLGIMGCAFLDNERLVTASNDKTVKIWNLKEKSVIMTLLVKNDKKLDTSYMLLGVATNGKKIYACSLGGTVYYWNVDTMADNKLPDASFFAHRLLVNCCNYIKSTKQIVSSDSDGNIIIWNEDGQSQLLKKLDKPISKLLISNDESLIYVLQNDGAIFGFTKDKFEQKVKIAPIDDIGRNLVLSRKNNDLMYLLTNKSIISLEKGNVKKKVAIKVNSNTFEVNEELGEIYIGDDKGNLHVFDMEFKETSQKKIFQQEITAIKLSPDSKVLLMGSSGKVTVNDAGTKEPKFTEWSTHSSKVTDLDVTEDSKYFISGSIDNSVIIREVDQRKEVHKFMDLNGNMIYKVKFVGNNKDFICCGANCSIDYVACE